MEITPVEVLYYRTLAGRNPVKEWIHSLDASVQQIIDARIIRVRRGLFGDMEPVGGGVSELKFDLGPGYRIYFGRQGRTIVILLQGGDKRSQSSDIEKAKAYWADYLGRTQK